MYFLISFELAQVFLQQITSIGKIEISPPNPKNVEFFLGCPFTDFSRAHARFSTFRPGRSKTDFSRFFAQSSNQSYIFQTFENHKDDAKVLEEVQKATKYKKKTVA